MSEELNIEDLMSEAEEALRPEELFLDEYDLQKIERMSRTLDFIHELGIPIPSCVDIQSHIENPNLYFDLAMPEDHSEELQFLEAWHAVVDLSFFDLDDENYTDFRLQLLGSIVNSDFHFEDRIKWVRVFEKLSGNELLDDDPEEAASLMFLYQIQAAVVDAYAAQAREDRRARVNEIETALTDQFGYFDDIRSVAFSIVTLATLNSHYPLGDERSLKPETLIRHFGHLPIDAVTQFINQITNRATQENWANRDLPEL